MLADTKPVWEVHVCFWPILLQNSATGRARRGETRVSHPAGCRAPPRVLRLRGTDADACDAYATRATACGGGLRFKALPRRHLLTLSSSQFDPMYGPAARRKRYSSIWRRAVLHQCIRPFIGARRLLAIMDISAPAILLADRPRVGHFGSQCSHAPGRPNLHLVSSSRERSVRDPATTSPAVPPNPRWRGGAGRFAPPCLAPRSRASISDGRGPRIPPPSGLITL